MRTIVVDPIAKTVTERDVEDKPDIWHGIVGGPVEFQADILSGDTIYATEPREERPYHYWTIEGEEPLMFEGIAFIIGHHGDRFVEPKATLAKITSRVRFLPIGTADA
jgi:hypothetical protein